MAKKRVYELAKDLGLSNKEMVDWLRAHEYDVKSHSSSLEDDQALAVVEKFRGEKPARAEAPKPSGSGVVLRRKKADTAAEHEHAAVLAAQQAAIPAEAPARPPVEVRRPEPPPVLPETRPEPRVAAGEARPPAAAEAAPVVEPPVPAPVERPAPVAAAPVEAASAAAPAEQKPAAVEQPAPSGPRAVDGRRSAQPVSNVPAGVAKVAARPAPPPPPRPHVRPPPPKPTGPIVQGPGGVQSVQVTENLQARPSATRAVVLSRPLIPVARPAPRSGPGGGGFRPRPVGEVRELAVVSGGPGRGREFIDVTKDNKGGPGQRGK